MVREHMGPVAAFRLAVGVKALPTTRSGKICRKSIADLARNKLKKVLLFDSGKGFCIIFVELSDPRNCVRPYSLQRNRGSASKTRVLFLLTSLSFSFNMVK